LARLYANENFPLRVVMRLRALGHDVETVQETGRAGTGWPDAEVLAYASQQNRIVMTLNRRDYIRLHKQLPGHAGIIVCSVDTDSERLAQRVDSKLNGDSDLSNQLIRLNLVGA